MQNWKKRILCVILTLCTIAVLLPAAPAMAADGEAECTHEGFTDGICDACGAYEPAQLNDDNVYEIGNPGQLLWFAELVNSNADDMLVNKAVEVDAKLTADIDMTGLPWIPIGQYGMVDDTFTSYGFGGTFDGCGHTVSGIDCTVTTTGSDSAMDSPAAGFFGKVYNATIRNLIVQGSFSAVYAGTSVNPTARAGGIVAYADGRTQDYPLHTVIENCGFVGTLSAEGKNMTQVGGIAGYCQVSLKNCWSAATVKSSGATYQRLGGLVGVDSRGTYENCYYDSTLCDLSACNAGDLSGVTAKTTEQFASGEVAYLLGEPFGQNIDNGGENEGHPVFSEAKVYYGYLSCDEEAAAVYTNDSAASDTKPAHAYENGICSRCGDTLKSRFVDVLAGSYYFDPVEWAVEKGITTGTDETHFSPVGSCQRAAVVTFLWRAAGSPEPTTTENPFVDVPSNAFYYKAVLWAVENNITNGVDATHFAPMQECSRAHVVTFLWRAQNCPESTSEVSFKDVESGKFYTDAVAWAVEKGITNGLDDTTFGVAATCNRAQVVTFLFRSYK